MEKEVLTPFPPCSHTRASCFTLSDPILAILAGTDNSPATWGASTRKPLLFSCSLGSLRGWFQTRESF